MKKHFLVLLFMILLTITVLAHPGRTDANGGHYNHSTGEYHYHHGYPAHQHENGQCPYDNVNRTDHRPISSTTSETTPISSQNAPWISVLEALALGAFLPCIGTGPGAVLYIIGSFRDPEPLKEFKDRFITALKTCFVISAVGGVLLSAFIGFPLLWEYLRKTIVGKIALSAYHVLGGGLLLLGVGGSLLLIAFIFVPAIFSGISSKFKK